MTQNINLLDELTIHKVPAFSSRLIMKIALAWIILLSAIYLIAYGLQRGQQKTLSQLETTQKDLNSQIKSYDEILLPFKEPGDTKDLTTSSNNTLGFYRYLVDLSKFIPHGVWLNSITFAEPGEIITIKGSAITAAEVSSLINTLSESESFKNKKLDTLQLQENLKSGNTDFTIGSILYTKQPEEENESDTN